MHMVEGVTVDCQVEQLAICSVAFVHVWKAQSSLGFLGFRFYKINLNPKP